MFLLIHVLQHDLTIINQYYIILCMTDFDAQKWSNEFPKELTCNKTFLGNILKESETHLFLCVLKKIIFFKWIFPRLVSQTTTFRYFFPKFSVYKRGMFSSDNLLFYSGMPLYDFSREINIIPVGILRIN